MPAIHPSSPSASPDAIGALLRDWRSRRRVSQMDLALDVGVSPRHLSFVETGRSRPSPSVLLALAERLDVPLRERNRLLLAAGYAPRYAERALEGGSMQGVRAALERLLGAHDPYPGLALDRYWNVVLGNRAALAMLAQLPPPLRTDPLNLFRASLHPEGFAAVTANFDEWGAYLLDTMARVATKTGDPGLLALEAEVLAFPNVQALRRRRAATVPPEPPPLLVTCIVDTPQGRLSMFTTLTTFGSPRDVTLDELCIEMFYPADESSAAMLRASGQDAGSSGVSSTPAGDGPGAGRPSGR